MEWIFYTAIVTAIAVVVAIVTYHFCMYVREHNGLHSWRNARFEARLHKTDTPQIRFLSPDQVVVAAKNVRCDCQHDAIARTIHVVLSGDFDEYDVQNLL